MLKFIFFFFVFTFLIRFVMRVVLPFVRGAGAINSRMRQMQDQMNGMQNGPPPPAEKPAPRKGDYIDFEEVK